MIRAEMMARMPGSEFNKWKILEQIEPFGDRRLDLLCGILGAIMANLHGRGPDDPQFTPDQFMPDFDPESEESQPAEEQERLLDFFFQHARTDS